MLQWCLVKTLRLLTCLQGKRINETVPPPHHHCFIPERSPQNFLETNSSRFQSRLTDDLCMMVGLDKALNWSIQYERENRRNQFTTCLGNVKHSIEQIIVGLSNITSVPVTYCMTNGDTRVFMESRRRSDEVESEVMYETSQPSPNDIPDSTQVCIYFYKFANHNNCTCRREHLIFKCRVVLIVMLGT